MSGCVRSALWDTCIVHAIVHFLGCELYLDNKNYISPNVPRREIKLPSNIRHFKTTEKDKSQRKENTAQAWRKSQMKQIHNESLKGKPRQWENEKERWIGVLVCRYHNNTKPTKAKLPECLNCKCLVDKSNSVAMVIILIRIQLHLKMMI